MQNFTLRFKGKLYYLLTLTLLIGSLPSIYGQSCPTVDNSSQSFCNALSTVADLDVNGDNVQWYDEAGSTNPLPMNEVLVDGEDYFADSPDCTDSAYTRAEVTVTITGPAMPTVMDDFFTPCSGGGPYTIADLKEAIDASTAPDGYSLEIFSTRYGKNDAPLADGTTLTVGNYYAGFYSASNTDPNGTHCQSERKPVRFEPVEANAPAAPSPQTVCEGTTVSELQAEGTNLWYRTATSQPALPDDTEVQNGVTYYASQIVPSDGPPCESTERTAVTVTVLPADAGEDNTDNTLCVSDADSQLNNETNARNYFLSLLENNFDADPSNDVPTTGSFDMATLTEIVADYNDGTKAGTYQTTYTVTFSNGCEDSVVLGVNVAEDPNPGTDAEEDVCVTDIAPLVPLAAANLPAVEAAIRSYLGGAGVDTDGEFTPTIENFIATLSNDIDNNNFPKTYTIDYTVNNNGCEKTATVTLNVSPENDAGTSASQELCETDVDDQGIFVDEASLKAYYLNLLGTDDDSGSFNPALSTLISNYSSVSDPSEDFTTEYTVDNGVCAPASATATLTVIKAVPAETGTIANQTYCSNDDAVVLSSLLDSTANPDGVFTSDDADVADGSFDPSAEGAGTYTITYTVSPETACVTTTATETFSIQVNQAPNAGPGGEFTFCQGEFEILAAMAVSNPSALLDEFGEDITTGGDFTSDNLATLLAKYSGTTSFPASFKTTYTVSNADCTDSASYTVTITPNEEVSAGGDQKVTFCTTDEDKNLINSLGDGATPGGSFVELEDGMFSPSEAGAGVYTFTYTVNGDSDPCLTGSDSASIEVTVIEGTEAGAPVKEVICVNDVADDLFTEDGLTAYYLGLLGEGVPTDGTFDPSISDLVADYNGGMTTGDFITTYTIGEDPCSDSVKLTLTIRPVTDADLTEVENPAPICQNAGVQTLTDFIGDNPDFGVFEGYEDGTFNPATMAPGDYDITYTLDEATTSCVTGSDSITFTITVLDSANAGMNMEYAVCQNAGEQNLFNRLAATVDKTGQFTYNGSVIAEGKLKPSNYAPGTYEITYTVPSENDCGNDIATLTLTIRGIPNAGGNMTKEVCQNDDVVDLFGMLAADTDKTGKFLYNGNEITDGQMDPSDFEDGTYTITYQVTNNAGACSDSALFTITVKDAANAGEDMELDVCMNEGVQDLFASISAGADTNGEFTYNGEVILDGEMDPMDFEPGEYEVTYTVAAINDCGDDTATFKVTVQAAPDAPEVNDLSFCAIQNPTGADLMVEGENLTFYTDEDLTMMVMAEDELTSATYYVTQRNAEGNCESEASAITITVNDPGTPTIDDTNQTFCEYDDATIADLNDAVDQTSNVTWYDSADSTDPLSTGTALQDGVTYYASLYDPETDCDSSERLAVTVTIEDCPLLFPEGISPNGDGKNDTFDIENIEREYPNYTISIRNRWGDLIYKGNANTPDWDGTTNQSGSLGEDVLPVGVYFYLLDFNDGVTAPRRGKIYLSR